MDSFWIFIKIKYKRISLYVIKPWWFIDFAIYTECEEKLKNILVKLFLGSEDDDDEPPIFPQILNVKKN